MPVQESSNHAAVGVQMVRLHDRSDLVDQWASAALQRRVLDCLDEAGHRTVVPAEQVHAACLRAAEFAPFGIRLANALINGDLDLRAMAVPVPLHFLGCGFDSAPQFDGADVHELAFVAGGARRDVPDGVLRTSFLPGLLGNGVRIRRDLVLSGTRISGAHTTTSSTRRTSAVWLTEAAIGGRLLAVGTVIDTQADRAIQADRTSVAGDIRLIQGFSANAEVRLIAVRLGGSLDLTGGSINARSGRALDVAEATIGGSFFLLDDPEHGIQPVLRGRIEMGRAVIGGRFMIRNAQVHAPPTGAGWELYNSAESTERAALIAAGLTVRGELLFEQGTSIDGGLVLTGAQLEAGASLDNVSIRNPGNHAIDLSQARLGAWMSMQNATVEGTVNLANTRVRGPLALNGTRLDHPRDHRCLIGIGAQIEGDLRLPRLSAHGGSLNLRAARIGGTVDAQAADLRNPDDKTLGLQHAIVAGNVRMCQGFRSDGLVLLNRADIQGRLRCDAGTFTWDPPAERREEAELNPLGSAFEAISATVRAGIGLGWKIESGGVDFTDATTSFLADRAEQDWPTPSHLTGFTYQRWAPAIMTDHGRGDWDPEVRAQWLARVGGTDSRPWEQAAKVLRDNGDPDGAERLLIASHRHQRRHLRGHPWRRLLDVANQYATGYGYRPQRTLYLMAALIVAVSLTLHPTGWQHLMRAADPAGTVFTPTGAATATVHGRCGQGSVRCFNPVLYAVDTVVPIINLDQRATWHPNAETPEGTYLEWWLSLCTILGWAASTIFALSLARLARTTP